MLTEMTTMPSSAQANTGMVSAQRNIFRGEGHVFPTSNGGNYTVGQLWYVFSVYRLVFWVAVLGFFSFLLHILQPAICTSTYPSISAQIHLVQDGGLHLALEPQPAGPLRAAAGSYSSLGPQLLEQSKEENNNRKMHPVMCGFKKKKMTKMPLIPDCCKQW